MQAPCQAVPVEWQCSESQLHEVALRCRSGARTAVLHVVDVEARELVAAVVVCAG